MRYQVKYIGFSIHAVVDTQAPESVCGDTSQGHILLWCLNGSQPCQVAADALNAMEENGYSTPDSKQDNCKTCEVPLHYTGKMCPHLGTLPIHDEDSGEVTNIHICKLADRKD